MSGLADLLRPRQLDIGAAPAPAVMTARILDTDPLRVTVPALDGRKVAHPAHGTLPAEAAPGDDAWVTVDQDGDLVLIAWQAT